MANYEKTVQIAFRDVSDALSSRLWLERQLTIARTALATQTGFRLALGGAQAMITVVGRDELEAAMREPERWGQLMVRVGGFSARFVDLTKELQKDIIRRTFYE